MHSDYVSWRERIDESNYFGIIDNLSYSELKIKVDELAKKIKNTKDKILKPFLGDYI